MSKKNKPASKPADEVVETRETTNAQDAVAEPVITEPVATDAQAGETSAVVADAEVTVAASSEPVEGPAARAYREHYDAMQAFKAETKKLCPRDPLDAAVWNRDRQKALAALNVQKLALSKAKQAEEAGA